MNFNPCGPCGPRPRGAGSRRPPGDFNPRGPCGPRRKNFLLKPLDRIFQSSRSLRTATGALPGNRPTRHHFNPRGPCGPRPLGRMWSARTKAIFQSSRSLRTATLSAVKPVLVTVFQSSRSLRTATSSRRHQTWRYNHFNPRGPCGPRPLPVAGGRGANQFQSSRSLRTATPRAANLR